MTVLTYLVKDKTLLTVLTYLVRDKKNIDCFNISGQG